MDGKICAVHAEQLKHMAELLEKIDTKTDRICEQQTKNRTDIAVLDVRSKILYAIIGTVSVSLIGVIVRMVMA